MLKGNCWSGLKPNLWPGLPCRCGSGRVLTEGEGEQSLKEVIVVRVPDSHLPESSEKN